MEPSLRDPVSHTISVESHVTQLLQGNDPVLTASNLHNPKVNWGGFVDHEVD